MSPQPDWQAATASGLAALDALAPEWLALCRRSDRNQPFWHPGWIRAHVLAFEKPDSLRLLTARNPQGELGAVLPLITELAWHYGFPVRRWRGAAGVHSLRFDLATAAGDEGAAATDAIAACLLQSHAWDILELRDVPAGGRAERLLQAALTAGHRVGKWESMQTPFIALDVDAVDNRGQPLPRGLQGTKADFRHHLRRTRRKLEAELGGELLLHDHGRADPPQLAGFLDQFYRVEASGWKGRNGTAIACLPAVRRFYDQAAAAMAAESAFVLHRLAVAEQTVAMSYSLAMGDEYFAIKWAYDDAYARFGAGHLLTEAILRSCVAPEAAPPRRRFDFTGPDADYKQKWTQTRQSHAYLYVFRRGVRGRWLAWLKFSLVPWARTRLARFSRNAKLAAGSHVAEPPVSAERTLG
ncbi:MAG: GNAT family N-acetyltransferase [Terriglobales bacterium]